MARSATTTTRRRSGPRRAEAPSRPRIPQPEAIPVFGATASNWAVRLLALSPWLVAVVCVAVVASGVLPVGVAVVLGLIAIAAVALAVANARLGSTDRVIAALGGRPADPASDARLVNLVDGLCFTFGLSLPRLVVLDSKAANTITLGRAPESATIIVTTGALSALGRIELEALLAHELAHIRRGDVARAAAVMRAVGAWATFRAGGERLAASLAGTGREALADYAAVAVTRYPPALADALEALAGLPVAPEGLSPALLRLTSWQWCAPLAPPSATPRPGALSLSERVGALREL